MTLRDESEAAQLKARLEAAERQRDNHHEAHLSALDRAHRAESEAAALHAQLAAANARVAELERLHEQALSERDAAHLSLESMTAGRDSALELAADISDQRDAANARVAELEALVDACSANFDAMVEMRNERDEMRDERDTANARVAELEARKAHVESVWVEKFNSANARADAAERREQAAEQNVVWLREQRDRAESKAAALRAEVERRESERNAAEDEAIAVEKQLAAANALLREVEVGMMGKSPFRSRIQDHLAACSGQAPARAAPAPTEREAAERAVLEACAALTDFTLEVARDYESGVPEELRPVCLAELTRREAAK